MKNIFYYIVIIFLIFTSCQKFENQELSSTQVNFKSQINIPSNFSVESGILVFKTEEDFINTLQTVSQMSYNDYLKWCELNNFKSLQNVFIDAYNKEAEYNDYCEQMQQENPNFVRNRYSNIVEKLLNSKLLKEVKSEKGSVILEINTCRKWLSYLLDTNKMVSINGDIYQYNEKEIKIIKNNDFSKIKQIDNISETQKDGSVIIWREEEFSKSYPSNHKSPIMTVLYDYRTPLFGNPYYKRSVEYFTESFLQKATLNGPYYLSFYAQLTNKKDGKENRAFLTKFLKNSNFEMSCETTSGVEIDNFYQQRNVEYDNTATATYYYVNGVHPIYDNNTVVHMWHVTDNIGTLYFYVKDKYWEPNGTMEPDINFSYKVRSNYLIK